MHVEKQSRKRTRNESKETHEPHKQDVRRNAYEEDTQLQEKDA